MLAGARTRSIRRAGRVVRRQDVARPVVPLPVRYRCLARRVRHEARALHQLHLVDVAWAVAKYLAHIDAHDELSFGILGHEWIVWFDSGHAVQPQPPLILEIDEEQADLR